MGPDEREAAIRSLFWLVKRIARRAHRLVPSVEVGDLVGDGSIGLIRAVDQFDPTRGTTLEQYAQKLISGAMLNGIRRMDPVSERARRAIRDGERTRYQLALERGSVPTDSEVEALQPGFVRASGLAENGVPVSLDAPLPEGLHVNVDWSGDPERIVLARHRREEVRAIVELLPERQRRVLQQHYYGERSLREVGRQMNISAQRASQLHSAAIARIKEALDAAAC